MIVETSPALISDPFCYLHWISCIDLPKTPHLLHSLTGMIVETSPAPSSGPILAFMMNVLDTFTITSEELNDYLLVHKFIEVCLIVCLHMLHMLPIVYKLHMFVLYYYTARLHNTHFETISGGINKGLCNIIFYTFIKRSRLLKTSIKLP